MEQTPAILVPELSALVYTTADVPFERLVAAVERALGVHFVPDTDGNFEELNALVRPCSATPWPSMLAYRRMLNRRI